MEHSATSRAFLRHYGLTEELLIVGAALGLTIAALLSSLALPLAVSGVVFGLAAIRYRSLMLIVVFFLPITPFLNWNFPIRDLSTLVRFSFFTGVLVYRLGHRQELRGWLWSGWLTRAVLGYFAVIIVSTILLNPLTLDAQRELMRLASYICFYYVITDWVETREDARALFKVLMSSAIVVAIFGFYQVAVAGYTSLYDILYPVREEILQIPPWEGRITSFLEHYNGLAGYLNLIIPFSIGFALRGTDPTMRMLGRWCFALASLALLLTQSRGGLLAYFAILIVSACFFAPNRKSRMRRIALVLVVCLLATVVAGLFFQRLAEIDDYTTVSRLAIWGGAFTVFAHSPVWGIGFGNFRTMLGSLLGLPQGWVGDAHNLYLELLAETGLVGFITFMSLSIVVLRRSARQYRYFGDPFDKIIGFAVFAAIVGLLVHGTVDYLFHTTPQVAVLLFLVLGILQTRTPEQSAATLKARPS